jgi:hypothetical protein
VSKTEDQRNDRVLENPEEWLTGDEPWTTAQRAYLQTLAREAGADEPDEMTKAEASKLIDELRQRTGRN